MHIQGPVIKQTIKPTIKLMTSLSLKWNVGPADLLGVVPHSPEVNGLTGDKETSANVSTMVPSAKRGLFTGGKWKVVKLDGKW